MRHALAMRRLHAITVRERERERKRERRGLRGEGVVDLLEGLIIVFANIDPYFPLLCACARESERARERECVFVFVCGLDT